MTQNKWSVLFYLALFLLLMTSCGLPIVDPALPNLPDRELVGSGPSPTPVIPTGGTYDDPVINLAGSCPTFENFIFHVLYSPADMTITQVHSIPTGAALTCTPVRPGDTACSGAASPYITPVRLDVCYRTPSLVEETCTEVSMPTPGCSPPVGTLLSVDCLRGNKVHFVVDTGASWRGRQCVCADVEAATHLCNCESGSKIYICQEVPGSGTQISCEGEAPIGNFPLAVQYFVEGMDIEIDYPLASRFDDFYSRYLQACRQVAPGPTVTSLVPAGPVPTCEDLVTYDSCKMFGGCYWWTNSTCHSDSEPPPPPPACSTYNNGLDCGNAGCNWWVVNMTCHPDTDPCHKYDGDDKGCAAAACIYDTKDNTCNTP